MTTTLNCSPTTSEIEDALISEIANSTGKAPDEFGVNSSIAELGVDRMELQAILFDVEHKLHIVITVPDRKVVGNINQTIRQLASNVLQVLNAP